MSQPSRNGAQVEETSTDHDATQDVVVKLLRIKDNHTTQVLTLSDTYAGAWFHYIDKRSYPCPGEEECELKHDRHRPQWRGYTPVLVNRPAEQIWLPYVLEITPHLELDFRGKFARGQVWDLKLAKGNGGPRRPVTGHQVRLANPDMIPLAFDVHVPLLHIFSVERLDLTIDNPMPPRLVMSGWKPPPPAGTPAKAPAATHNASQERARLAALQNGKHVSVDAKSPAS